MSSVADSTFPAQLSSHHLTISTAASVLSWNEGGLKKVFASGSKGIIAAKESKGGNGTLAIADSAVVVLHRVQGDWQRSYRLKGAEGRVRVLQFSNDSNTLFFTTSHLNAVQCYSILDSKLGHPCPVHPSPPTVFASSYTNHLILSASENPPVVCLQSLIYRSNPVYLTLDSSTADVVAAKFHPSRPNVFALAFRDGTITAYDATKIIRQTSSLCGNAKAACKDAEIGSFLQVHAVTSTGIPGGSRHASTASDSSATFRRGSSITGLDFIPGYRSRIVTVGTDGRCKIADFQRNKIVSSWHVKGPATAVSVLRLEDFGAPESTVRIRKDVTTADSAETIIAVGRIDGKVVLFDINGSILATKTVDNEAGSVLDLEWIQGPGPDLKDPGAQINIAEDSIIDIVIPNAGGRHSSSSIEPTDANEARKDTVDHMTADLTGGTILHREIDAQAKLEFQAPNMYMDLFSPVKDVLSPEEPRIKKTISRPRTRLSSSTFVNSIQDSLGLSDKSPIFIKKSQSVNTSRNPLNPLASTAMNRKSQSSNAPSRALKDTSLDQPQKIPQTTKSNHSKSSQPTTNSTILAHIKKLKSERHKSHHPSSSTQTTTTTPAPSTIRARKSALRSDKRSSRRSSGPSGPSGGPTTHPFQHFTRTTLKSQARPRLPASSAEHRVPDDAWATAESSAASEAEDAHPPPLQPGAGGRRQTRFASSPRSDVDALRAGARARARARRSRDAASATEGMGPFAEIPSELYGVASISTLSGSASGTRSGILGGGAMGVAGEGFEYTGLESVGPLRRSGGGGGGGVGGLRGVPLPQDEKSVGRNGRRKEGKGNMRMEMVPCTGVDCSEEEVIHDVASGTSRDSGVVVLDEDLEDDETYIGDEKLRPGWADSFQGPVEVRKYLPRRGSLKARDEEVVEMREAVRGSDVDECKACEALRNEVAELRKEVNELRRLVKGKARAI